MDEDERKEFDEDIFTFDEDGVSFLSYYHAISS